MIKAIKLIDKETFLMGVRSLIDIDISIATAKMARVFRTHSVQTGWRPTQPPAQWVLGTLSLRGKAAGA
jgi:hypothetical protein